MRWLLALLIPLSLACLGVVVSGPGSGWRDPFNNVLRVEVQTELDSSLQSGSEFNGVNFTLDSRFFWCTQFRSDASSTLLDDCTADGTSNNLTTKVGTPTAQNADVPDGSSADARSGSFDGVSDLWKVADAADGPFDVDVLKDNGGFTAGCYARLDLGGGIGWMLNKNNAGGGMQWGLAQISETGHRFYTGLNVSVTNATSAPDDVWYQHVGRYATAGTLSEGFINMVPMTPVVRTTAVAAIDEFGVGSNMNESQEWNGSLTDCWVADKFVQDAELCRVCRCGLAGDHAADRLTNCNSCTMLTSSCDTGAATSLRSIDFTEGTGEILATAAGSAGVTDFGFPNASGAFTVSAWAKAATSGFNDQFIVAFGDGGGAQNRMWLKHDIDANVISIAVTDGGGGAPTKEYALNTIAEPAVGTWYMFTATYDGANGAASLKLYLDGVLEGTPTKTLDADISSMTPGDMRANLAGGGGETPGNGFNGNVFAVDTWSSVLTTAEIVEMFALGSPAYFDPRVDFGDYVSSDDIVGLWYPGSKVSPNLGFDYVGGNHISRQMGTLTDDDISTDIPQ